MELTIKTQTLQDMAGKAIQCSSDNKLIPITSLMNVKMKDNKLTLTTTDATNYFYVTSADKFDCEDFEVSILAEVFAKLVQKTTSDKIKLTIHDGILEVKGNGTYKIEMPLDENGGIIKFPSKLPAMEPPVDGIIKKTTVSSILNYNKTALATNMEIPSLTNYYCGQQVITSDGYKICAYDINVLKDKTELITPQFMELLGIMSEENINFHIDGDEMIFWDATETVYAPVTEGVDQFPVDAIMKLVGTEFKSHCKLSKSAVISVLDRLSLFVSPYDKKGIYLTFTKEGLSLSSKKSSGTEIVPYISSDDFADFSCCIDVEMLKSQVSACEGENIDMYYGLPMAVKMVTNNVTQIAALMMEETGV